MNTSTRGLRRATLSGLRSHQSNSEAVQNTSNRPWDGQKLPADESLKADLVRFAFKASTIGYWVWDRETGQVHLSDACFTMLQLSKADFSNNIAELKSLIHPHDYVYLKHCLNEYVEHEITFEFAFRLKRRDQSYIWVSLAGQADDDKSKTSCRVGGSITDASANVKLRNQLMQERQNLRMIFDNVPARIWLKDSHNTDPQGQ